MLRDITPDEFMQRRAAGADLTLLDVREDWEVKAAPAPTAFVHIPMGEVAARLGELDPSKEIAVLCLAGARSMQVARFLEHHRFAAVANVSGGISAWRLLDPSIPAY